MANIRTSNKRHARAIVSRLARGKSAVPAAPVAPKPAEAAR